MPFIAGINIGFHISISMAINMVERFLVFHRQTRHHLFILVVHFADFSRRIRQQNTEISAGIALVVFVIIILFNSVRKVNVAVQHVACYRYTFYYTDNFVFYIISFKIFTYHIRNIAKIFALYIFSYYSYFIGILNLLLAETSALHELIFQYIPVFCIGVLIVNRNFFIVNVRVCTICTRRNSYFDRCFQASCIMVKKKTKNNTILDPMR